MYSTTTLIKNSKKSGRLVGTHQKIDKIARRQLGKHLPKGVYFPSEKEILYFEGTKGPDGLKRKCPGIDEPEHFILPEHDDGVLIGMILDHQYNLHKALASGNEVRAAFEAAWMAHAITDGLTPAHHFPFQEAIKELMSDKEFLKIFGTPIKGIMPGKNLAETTRNNWLYWGAGGYMNKHVAFEYGAAVTTAATPAQILAPKIQAKELYGVDLRAAFYNSLRKIHALDMYNRFRREGWTAELAFECRDVLMPEIIRAVMLGWASAVPELVQTKASHDAAVKTPQSGAGDKRTCSKTDTKTTRSGAKVSELSSALNKRANRGKK